MVTSTSNNDDPLLQAIQECWPRLPAGIREAIAATVVYAADKSDQPARRTRHRKFTSDEITALRAKTAACIAESPTISNRLIAAQIGIALSTYKLLRLHVFVRQTLIESAEPRSATRGFGGERAGGQDENEDET